MGDGDCGYVGELADVLNGFLYLSLVGGVTVRKQEQKLEYGDEARRREHISNIVN